MQAEFRPLAWARKTNIYEVNTRQYTAEGTFRAFQKEMPRLRDMGVETLWFMPVMPISEKGRKGTLGSYYACADYTAINPELGSLEDFRALVSEAHRLGMKVIIDWVANHTGCDHRWTEEHPAFYKRNAAGHFYDAHGWDDVIDLDYENPDLWEAMIRSMIFWIDECDIDGFRCDMAMLTPVRFWAAARRAVDQRKPLFWLAELDPLNDPDYMTVFDAAYTWTWMHESKAYYESAHRSTRQLFEVLFRYDEKMPASTLPMFFTSNHDENSWNGTEFEKYGAMALPLAVFSCTWPGIPLLYSGQEFPNHKRLLFFDKDPIEKKIPAAYHDFYRKLLWLRSWHPGFLSGGSESFVQRVSTSHEEQVFAFLRRSGDRDVLVVLNLTPYEHWDFAIRDNQIVGSFRELFSGSEQDLSLHPGYHMGAWGYQVWVK